MAETPKNPPPGNRSTASNQQPAKDKPPTGNPAARHHVAARKLREQRQQRLVITITAAAISLALLIIIGGLVYDRLWVPSQAVARTGSATLSRGDYWAERRRAYAREVVQNFQLLALFGGNPQFTQQFQGQSPTINAKVKLIRTAEVDAAVVGQWETRQIKDQGAAGRSVSVTQDEANQALVKDLAQVFLPPPTAPVSATGALTPTGELSATGELTPTSELSATGELTPTATPGGPTATPEPTSTPLPTPVAAEAATQLGLIVDEIFRRYEIELATTGDKPVLTKDDFRSALADQYHEQVINERVQAQLVPTEGFAYSQEPTKVQASQVLVAVTPPTGATQAQSDAAFAEAKGKADTLAAELRGGADFATVVAASSDDPGSKAKGGDLGLFDKDGKADSGVTYPPELVQQAFALAKDAISAPIRTQFGWHIIKVTTREVPAEDQQLRDARTKALDAWVAEQRKAISVARFPELTPTANVAPTVATPTAVPTFVAGPPTVTPTAPVPTAAAPVVLPEVPTATVTTTTPTGAPTAAAPTSATAAPTSASAPPTAAVTATP